MILKLIWSTSQDQLYFDVINDDLAVWFVKQSTTLGQNRFQIGDQLIDTILNPQDSQSLIAQEIAYVQTTNEILTKLRLPIFDLPNDWYDQTQLNRLHKDWAQLRYQQPRLTELLYKIDRKYFEAYQEMNCHIHLIERSFQYRFRDKMHWRANNPFQQKAYDWQMCHLYLEYPGHGRNAYEKFQWMDDGQDADRDNNNWENIDAFVGVNLGRPYKIEPPQEFLGWCQKQNLVPHGYTLPLANLMNWKDQLARARYIFAQNVGVTNNYFSLEITE